MMMPPAIAFVFNTRIKQGTRIAAPKNAHFLVFGFIVFGKQTSCLATLLQGQQAAGVYALVHSLLPIKYEVSSAAQISPHKKRLPCRKTIPAPACSSLSPKVAGAGSAMSDKCTRTVSLIRQVLVCTVLDSDPG